MRDIAAETLARYRAAFQPPPDPNTYPEWVHPPCLADSEDDT